MKLYLLLILIIPFSIFAIQENIGKKVIYDIIVDGRDQGILVTEIVGGVGENTYQRKTQLYIEESEKFISKEIRVEDIANAERTSYILKNCKKLSGKPDHIYASGMLVKACRLNIRHELAKERLSLLDFNEKDLLFGSVWIGKAPLYGILKLNSPDLIMNLTFSRWN